jgi:uncharacterized protein (TIGR02145 family)
VLLNQTTLVTYWSQTEFGPTTARNSIYDSPGLITPQTNNSKSSGFAVRCIWANNDIPLPIVVPATAAICNGASTTIEISGGSSNATVFWQNSATGTATNLGSGNRTVDAVGTYWFRAKHNTTGEWGQAVSTVVTAVTLTIGQQPPTSAHEICPNQTFPAITVLPATASPNTTVTYQWFRTAYPSIRTGDSASTGTGNNSRSGFVPENTIQGGVPYYFYFIATHTASGCAAVSDTTGAHVILGVQTPQPCGNAATGDPTNFDFGTVSFASNQEWTIIGTGANSHIAQIWSDAVTATNCDKPCYNGGSDPNFNVDCRSNPGQKGDLFSWCAVNRHAATLCPAPWRVPSRQDFINSDRAMGGTGSTRHNLTFVTNNYVNPAVWGGTFAGWASSGSLRDVGTFGNYWAVNHENTISGYYFSFNSLGNIDPLVIGTKTLGFSLRCVRDIP